jgi:PAS domain S-box-containing protein
MRREALGRKFSDATLIGILAITYVIGGKLGLKLAFVNEYATAVWPPTGIALTGLLLWGYRMWPGVLIGAFLVNVTTGDLSVNRMLASVVIASGNTLEALLGAYLVNRHARGAHAFERPQDAFTFAVVAAIVSTSMSATVGVTGLLLTGLAKWINIADIWLTWWIGDAAGDLVVAPALILWATNRRVRWSRGRLLVEAGLLSVCLSLLFLTVFTDIFSSGPAHLGLAIVCVPPLLWIAFRLGQREAATAMLLLSCIAVWGATHGLRIGQYSRAEVLLEVQAYLAIISVMVMTVAAEVAERKRREREQAHLTESLREHTKIVDLACVLVRDPNDRITQWSSGAEFLYGFSAREAVGRISHELFQTQFSVSQEEIRARLFNEGGWRGELRHKARGGQEIVVASLQALYRRQEGSPAAILEVNNDITDLKRAEERFRAAQQQLQLITDNMPAAVTRCSRNLHYVWVSRGYAAWIGRPAEEIAGRPIRDVIGDQAYEGIHPYIERVLAGERVEYTTKVNFLGPGERWIHAVYVPTYVDSKQVDGWIAVVVDCTDEKRTAEQLRAADQRVRALVTNSSDGIVLLDQHGNILLSGAPILGYTSDEWLGRNGMDLLHPEDRPEVVKTFTELVQQPGKTMTVRYRARHKGGLWRWIEAICRNLLEEPVVHGVVVNYRDITEQQQIENSLREQAQLLDLTQDAILSLRSDGAIEFWNRGAEECYGWAREEAFGQIAHELLKTEFPEPLPAIKARLAEDGFWQGELVHTKRDGNKVAVASRWAVRRAKDDQSSGYLEITTDINERKRVEKQLRQTQRLESLGILAGGIAHDFNNLLVGILGNASLALDVLGPTTPVRQMLEDLISTSERAASLTRQLLAYAGKEQLATQPINLSTMVRDLTRLLQTSIPKTVYLILDLQDCLPFVNGDQTQLQQVIMNLVINAVEAIPQHTPGTVTITTGARKPTTDDHEHAVTPLPPEDKTYVVLTVADTGQGMSTEIQARIFDPFYTTKFTGRGLGLAAVLGIVKAHKGAITLKTAPDAGTTFTLLLPSAGVAAPLIASSLSSERARGSGTILVVDDESTVRSVAQRTLEQYGYQVVLAENGHQAVDMLSDHPEIRAIILDLAMPVMTGDQAVPYLRRIHPTVPIILTSGYAEADAREQFAGAGITTFLQKPYKAATLLESIAASLGSV